MSEPEAKELPRCRDCGKPVFFNGDCYQLMGETGPTSIVCTNGAYHIAEYFKGEFESRRGKG